MNKGNIVQVIGPVVDVEFPDEKALPKIYNALEIEYEVNGNPTKLTLEVQQHLGDNWVRAVAMSTTEGLKRGMELTDSGKPISMPVGEAVMGRVFNVTGDAVDEQGGHLAAHLLGRHVDRGERRDRVLGEQRVVEADDGDLVGHRTPAA